MRYEGYRQKTENTRSDSGRLKIECLKAYFEKRGIRYDASLSPILREANGKPRIENSCFSGIPCHFSVSHSADLWIMAVGEEEIGIDVQSIDRRNFMGISKRYFSLREQAYVQAYGEEGFFRLWTHKEACAKLTGSGIFGYLPELVSEDGSLKTEAETGDGRKFYVRDMEIGDGMLFAFATYGKDDELCWMK